MTPKGDLVGTPRQITRTFERWREVGAELERRRSQMRNETFKIEEILDARGIGASNSIAFELEWQQRAKREVGQGRFDDHFEPTREQPVRPRMREILQGENYEAEKQQRLEWIQNQNREMTEATQAYLEGGGKLYPEPSLEVLLEMDDLDLG